MSRILQLNLNNYPYKYKLKNKIDLSKIALNKLLSINEQKYYHSKFDIRYFWWQFLSLRYDHRSSLINLRKDCRGDPVYSVLVIRVQTSMIILCRNTQLVSKNAKRTRCKYFNTIHAAIMLLVILHITNYKYMFINKLLFNATFVKGNETIYGIPVSNGRI